MQRECVHVAARLAHEYIGPFVVRSVRAAGDLVQLLVGIVAAVATVATHQIGIVLGAHIAAAAPVLVADTPELHVPRLIASVLAAQVRHRRDAVEVDVLHPLRHFLHGTAANISADVRFAADLLAEVEKFVGAKVVVFRDATPVGIDHGRAFFARANPVLPVIFVGKATAGPAQVGGLGLLERLDDILPDPTFIRNGRILANPVSIVNTPSEMLGEMAVNMPVDLVLTCIRIDHYPIHNHLRFFDTTLKDAKPRWTQSEKPQRGEIYQPRATPSLYLTSFWSPNLECGGRVPGRASAQGRRRRFSPARRITPGTTQKRCRRPTLASSLRTLPPHSKSTAPSFLPPSTQTCLSFLPL